MKERFNTFTVLISNIGRCIRKIKSEEMAEYNLKAPHVSCLYYLYKNGELTASELCEICDEDKGAISRSLVFLEKEGYIACDSDAKKRYKSRLYLTESGKKIGAEVAKKIDNVLDYVGSDLSIEKRDTLYSSLEIICADLQKIIRKYDNPKGTGQ